MTPAERLLVEVTSIARNAIFGSAGIAGMFCRQFQKTIHQSARCAGKRLCDKVGLLGALELKLRRREKAETAICNS